MQKGSLSTLLHELTFGSQSNSQYLGDLQLRARLEGQTAWIDSSTSFAREAVQPLDVSGEYLKARFSFCSQTNLTFSSLQPTSKGNELSRADITPTLGTSLPVNVTRTWSSEGDSLIMSFNLTNVGAETIEFGGVGFPLAFNNDWIDLNQEDTWTKCVMSDPALSLDAGFVLTNRLEVTLQQSLLSLKERVSCKCYFSSFSPFTASLDGSAFLNFN